MNDTKPKPPGAANTKPDALEKREIAASIRAMHRAGGEPLHQRNVLRKAAKP